jgi:hypothetical protein
VADPQPLPAGNLVQADFVASLDPDDLVYFCCNVGDADAQVVLLPEDHTGIRRVLIIDAGRKAKIPGVLDELAAAGLIDLADPADLNFPIALVVATHPHQDHMAGMPEILTRYKGFIAEFWDPGYFHTLGAYTNSMHAIAAQPRLVYAQPASGFQRWFGDTTVTVLSPSIQLRNRFDTYGVEINDASISLRIETPASRVREEAGRRTYAPNARSARLVLGADAQTLSWSYVLTDFPYLASSDSAVAKALGAAGGDWDALKADVFKVSHHCSKHGINLELVERIHSALTLISCAATANTYRFPHTVSQELIREALDTTTSSGVAHKPDHEIGIFYTCDTDDNGNDGGTIACVMNTSTTRLWRFGDAVGQAVNFANARRWT